MAIGYAKPSKEEVKKAIEDELRQNRELYRLLEEYDKGEHTHETKNIINECTD